MEEDYGILEQALHNLRLCKWVDYIHDVDNTYGKSLPDRIEEELKKLGYSIVEAYGDD